MSDNIQERSENPLKLPRKPIKPVDPKIYPEGIEEDKNYSDDIARRGGSGGKGIEVPTFQRNEQSKFQKLPQEKIPKKISNN